MVPFTSFRVTMVVGTRYRVSPHSWRFLTPSLTLDLTLTTFSSLGWNMNLPDQLQSALGSTHALPCELGRVGMATVYPTKDHRLVGMAGRSGW